MRLLRFARLSWRRQMLLVEALAAIIIASLAIRLLPFERSVRLGSRAVSATDHPAEPDILNDIRWSVKAVAARVPWRAMCFQQGVALQWMLRRRGIDARLHYGVGKEGAGSLLAHVWVSAGGGIVIGGEDAPAVRAVAVYP